MFVATELLPPATKLGQGYVFTGVCDSVRRGGVCLSACWDTHPPGADILLEQTPPGAYTPLGADPPEQTPPPEVDTPWEQTPPEQTPPQEQTPPEQTPPLRQTPWKQTPPRADTPPRRACWEIRSTRGRYASYWNAILFNTEVNEGAELNSKLLAHSTRALL